MKELYLIRHAKSSWGNSELKDFDRPLNHRGLVSAPEMGRRLSTKNLIPDAIFSSTAVRAMSTAKLVRDQLGSHVKIVKEPNAYHASAFLLLQIVNSVSNDLNSVFLVGHNPSLTDFAEYLTNEQFGNLPTAAVVGIRFSIEDWGLVSGSTGTLVFYDYPKKIS
ncbi:MAG: histidine phosphatase family protein [Vicingaceae bacterium]